MQVGAAYQVCALMRRVSSIYIYIYIYIYMYVYIYTFNLMLYDLRV